MTWRPLELQVRCPVCRGHEVVEEARATEHEVSQLRLAEHRDARERVRLVQPRCAGSHLKLVLGVVPEEEALARSLFCAEWGAFIGGPIKHPNVLARAWLDLQEEERDRKRRVAQQLLRQGEMVRKL